MSLRPQAVEISGAEAAVESGDVVSLLCTSMAARWGCRQWHCYCHHCHHLYHLHDHHHDHDHEQASGSANLVQWVKPFPRAAGGTGSYQIIKIAIVML